MNCYGYMSRQCYVYTAASASAASQAHQYPTGHTSLGRHQRRIISTENMAENSSDVVWDFGLMTRPVWDQNILVLVLVWWLAVLVLVLVLPVWSWSCQGLTALVLKITTVTGPKPKHNYDIGLFCALLSVAWTGYNSFFWQTWKRFVDKYLCLSVPSSITTWMLLSHAVYANGKM